MKALYILNTEKLGGT